MLDEASQLSTLTDDTEPDERPSHRRVEPDLRSLTQGGVDGSCAAAEASDSAEKPAYLAAAEARSCLEAEGQQATTTNMQMPSHHSVELTSGKRLRRSEPDEPSSALERSCCGDGEAAASTASPDLDSAPTTAQRTLRLHGSELAQFLSASARAVESQLHHPSGISRDVLERADRQLAAAAAPMNPERCARCQVGLLEIRLPCACRCLRLCSECDKRLVRMPDALKIKFFCCKRPTAPGR